ncbi:hypothetical protein [Vibrio cholerae]|nr:hypothetical protein [Vibrio cholerae]
MRIETTSREVYTAHVKFKENSYTVTGKTWSEALHLGATLKLTLLGVAW